MIADVTRFCFKRTVFAIIYLETDLEDHHQHTHCVVYELCEPFLEMSVPFYRAQWVEKLSQSEAELRCTRTYYHLFSSSRRHISVQATISSRRNKQKLESCPSSSADALTDVGSMSGSKKFNTGNEPNGLRMLAHSVHYSISCVKPFAATR